MFTGIVETTGKIISLKKENSNLRIGVEASFARNLKPGQSVAHNGVCLTVEKKISSKNRYVVSAVKETLAKTNLGSLKKGSLVNLERSLKVGDRLDGHFVQGHVDCTAICKEIIKQDGSFLFFFKLSRLKTQDSRLIIDKGSICINGVSLTVVKVSPGGGDLEGASFSVAIIPHTFSHTNFSSLKKGDVVNIEFDVLGKYIQQIIAK